MLGPNVYFLGLTSLFTDISSEMVSSILPVYLIFTLHLTPLQFGFIDGLYQGATLLSRLAGGVLADRWRKNREVAAVGYGLSTLCKLGLIAAGSVWTLLSSVILLDRIGKGIRTAPRDALLTQGVASRDYGLAFGIHRAFDTFGALLGPIVAFALLSLLPDMYDVVFVASFSLGLIGLAVLLFFVKNAREAAPRERRVVSMVEVTRLLRGQRLRRLVFVGAALGLCTVADSFIYLGLQKRLNLDITIFPLLYVVTAITFLALAIPAGRIADRIGRARVYFAGYVLLLLASLSLLMPSGGVVTAFACLGLLGAYYACTDGVLMALASTYLPEDLRASGFALLTTATGLTRFVASILFGVIWNWWGIESALLVFIVALGITLLSTFPILFRLEGSAEHDAAAS
ncbi:MAG: MFS transporter [Chromatiales bacterium]|nr:MFS transporter [Chromatiales bacterium]